MDFEIAEKISRLLAKDKLKEAINLLEDMLKQRESDYFNNILGKGLLHQSDALTEYFSSFYESVKDHLTVKAIYAEMNGFTINWDMWYMNAFAYDHVGGTGDTDWLADWEEGNSSKVPFVLTGFEDLQVAYKNYMDEEKWHNENLEAANDVAELLIVLRFQELVKITVLKAKETGLPWAKIPLFASAHDYDDLVYRVNN